MIVPYVVLVASVGVVFFVVGGGDWAQVAAGTTVASIVMRGMARRITFTFAEGFLAYRARNEWPRGVQEEYDVHYAWPASGRFSAGR